MSATIFQRGIDEPAQEEITTIVGTGRDLSLQLNRVGCLKINSMVSPTITLRCHSTGLLSCFTIFSTFSLDGKGGAKRSSQFERNSLYIVEFSCELAG
jgi:hypothetical protein